MAKVSKPVKEQRVTARRGSGAITMARQSAGMARSLQFSSPTQALDTARTFVLNRLARRHARVPKHSAMGFTWPLTEPFLQILRGARAFHFFRYGRFAGAACG
jgi:hypothetical protein